MKEVINMSHGAGGKSFDELLRDIILPAFDNPFLNAVTDGAILDSVEGRLVMSTDSHVVTPRIFPGGSLGKLAFCGTVNDLAVMGAKPLYLTMGMIVEEGLSVDEFRFHVEEIGRLSRQTGIPVVSGDTKVVERGKGDGLFITTSGIGQICSKDIQPDPKSIAEGDVVIINGPIGDHGICILSQRNKLDFETVIESDCAPLHELTNLLWEKFPMIKCMRDPTRGGVAAVLNELARDSKTEIEVLERNLPVQKGVLSACELLGLDPLQLANEGKFILFVPSSNADSVLEFMKQHPLGEFSEIIGNVHRGPAPLVRSTTLLGGGRIIPWPSGEQMPRIC